MSVEYYREALRNAIARKSAAAYHPQASEELLQYEVEVARELYKDARKKEAKGGNTED